MSDGRLAKIVGGILQNAHDLAEWGLDTDQLTENDLRHIVLKRDPKLRAEAAAKMIDNGMSQRKVADLLGVDQKTISNDLRNFSSEDEEKFLTEATKTRQTNEQKRKAELETPPELILEPGLHLGDFRELSHEIADESVQLVFTDPPYDEESVALYRDAAAVAARILKPGGSFIAYSGHKYLPEVLKACSYHLRYWWTIACVHQGGNQMLQRLGIRAGWKPLVWFVKGTRGDVQNVLLDVVSGDREKDVHEWQQAEAEAVYYIEKLTSPDGLVVDFFVGGGTTIAAAKSLGRRWIGFEVNAKSAEKASHRVSEVA